MHAPAGPGSDHRYRISIAIPAFNAEKYLAVLLESLASQWSPGVEIVIVDDASTDGTTEVIRTFEGDARLSITAVLRTHNQGIAATRNELIAHCRGDYIWFIDADDVALPGSVYAVKETLDRCEPDLLMVGFKNLHARPGADWRLGSRQYNCLSGPFDSPRTDIPRVLVELFDAQQLHVWSKIARRAVWASLQFPTGRTYEDIAISPLLVMASKSVVHLNRACIAYRRHPESITARMSGARLKDLGCSLQPAVQALRQQPQLVSPELSRSIGSYAARIQATMWQHRKLLTAAEMAENSPLSKAFHEAVKLTPAQLTRHLAISLRWKTLARAVASGLFTPRA